MELAKLRAFHAPFSIASKADLTEIAALSGLNSLTIGIQGDDLELFLESIQNFGHLDQLTVTVATENAIDGASLQKRLSEKLPETNVETIVVARSE